jgi:hypothetical protein
MGTGQTSARFITKEEKERAAAAGTPYQFTPKEAAAAAATQQRGVITHHTPTGPAQPAAAPVGVPAAQQPVAAPPVEAAATVVPSSEAEGAQAAAVVEEPAAVVDEPAAVEPPAGVVFGAAAVEVARSLGVPYVFDRATGAPVDFDRAAEMIADEPNSVCLDFNQLEPEPVDEDDETDTGFDDENDRAAMQGEPTDREVAAYTRPAGPPVEVRITPTAVRVEVGGPVRVSHAKAGNTRILNIQTNEPEPATEPTTENPTE